MRKWLAHLKEKPFRGIFAVFIILLASATSIQAQAPYLDMTMLTGSTSSVIVFLLTGFVLGLIGQVFRVAIGLKKEFEANKNTGAKWNSWFNTPELLVSLLLAGAAGTLAAIPMIGPAIDGKFCIACMAAGYAGSDFIQGAFFKASPAPPTSSTATTFPTPSAK